MDYKLQQTMKNAKAMANKELNNITKDKLESLAKQEKNGQRFLLIIILTGSFALFACSIFCFISHMVAYGVFTIIMAIAAFSYGIYALIKYKKKTTRDFAFDNLEKLYIRQPNLIDNDVIVETNKQKEIVIPNGLFSKNKIFINSENKTISFVISNLKSREYKFADLLRYEITEDGDSVVKGTAGRTLVGGMFFGLGGAIVGSSMSRKVKNKCNQLNVIVCLNDVNNPTINIPVLNVETNKNSEIYRNAISLAQEICGTLEYAMNQKTLHESSNSNDVQQKKEPSNKEQLKELKEMLDEGLITQEEFDKKKKQILGL